MKKEVKKKNLEKVVGGKTSSDEYVSAIMSAINFRNCIRCGDKKGAILILNAARKLSPKPYYLFKDLVNRMTGIDVDQFYPPKIN